MKMLNRSILASALALGLFAGTAPAAPDPALQGKRVPLVVQSQAKDKDKAGDEGMKKLLESKGLVVTVADAAGQSRQGDDLRLRKGGDDGL